MLTSTPHCPPAHTSALSSTPTSSTPTQADGHQASVHAGFASPAAHVGGLCLLSHARGKTNPPAQRNLGHKSTPNLFTLPTALCLQGDFPAHSLDLLCPRCCGRNPPHLLSCENPDGCRQVSDEVWAAPINICASSPYCPTFPARSTFVVTHECIQKFILIHLEHLVAVNRFREMISPQTEMALQKQNPRG